LAEHSSFWTTNATGDGSAYTQAQLAAMWKRLFTPSGYGVLFGYANELAVSGTSSPISVATGAAVVQGFMYENDAAKSVTVPTPAIGTTGHRVVLRVDWSAQTVRVVLKSSSDGVATLPALTQTINTVYEISLAGLTITTGGVITLTDERSYARFATKIGGDQIDTLTKNLTITTTTNSSELRLNNTSPGGKDYRLASAGNGNIFGAGNFVIYNATDGVAEAVFASGQLRNRSAKPFTLLAARQGGSPTDWSMAGSTAYSPTTVKIQMGSVAVSGTISGSVSVGFPEPFSSTPLVFVTLGGDLPVIVSVISASNTGVGIDWQRVSGTGVTGLPINWLAIGPA